MVHRADWARDCFVLMLSHEARMMIGINEQRKPSMAGERHKSQGTLVLPTYHGSTSTGSFLTEETGKKTAICLRFSF